MGGHALKDGAQSLAQVWSRPARADAEYLSRRAGDARFASIRPSLYEIDLRRFSAGLCQFFTAHERSFRRPAVVDAVWIRSRRLETDAQTDAQPGLAVRLRYARSRRQKPDGKFRSHGEWRRRRPRVCFRWIARTTSAGADQQTKFCSSNRTGVLSQSQNCPSGGVWNLLPAV